MNKTQIHIAKLSISTLLFFSCCAAFGEEIEPHHSASQAVGFSGGWIGGNGVTYRRYFGDYFLQGTFFGVVSNSGNNAYLNVALSAGKYLHKIDAVGIVPPIGLKVMAGTDFVLDRKQNTYMYTPSGDRTNNFDMSYFGAGVGLDIGNPGRAGLSIWLAANYVFSYQSISAPVFDSFGVRPATGILYSW